MSPKVQSCLRLRSTSLLLQLIAVLLISLTFLLSVRDNLLRTQALFEQSNKQIFDGETSRQLGYSLHLYEVSISQTITQSNQSLVSMQELYTLIQKEQQYIHTQSYPEYNLDKLEHTEDYDWQNDEQFGFQSTLPLDPLEYSSKLNFTRLLNEYTLTFRFFDDNVTIIAFVDYGPEQFYVQYPIDSNDAEYLQTDAQFCDFKASNLQNQLVTPMFNYANGPIYLSIFNQLRNSSNSVEGSLRYSQSIHLADFPQIYSIIADQDWNIHTYYGLFNYTSQEPIIPFSDNPEYIIDASSLTGFSQEDWFTIMTSEQSVVFSSLLQMDVYARRKKFQNSELIIVVYQDVSSYLAQQDQIMAQLQNFGTQIFKKFYITIVIFILGCGFFSVMIIVKILEPFSKLTLMVQNQIYSITKNDIRTSFFQQLDFSKHEANQSLNELFRAIINYQQRSSNTKSEQLQIFQDLSYPKTNHQYIQISFDNLFDNCSSMEIIQDY